MRILIAFFTLFLSIQSHAKLADGLYANLHTNQGDIIVQLAYKKEKNSLFIFIMFILLNFILQQTNNIEKYKALHKNTTVIVKH
jgi:hypothetical protein